MNDISQRYRDLIQSSDIIQRMHSSNQSINSHLKQLTTFGQIQKELIHDHSHTHDTSKYHVAASIKVLVDAPLGMEQSLSKHDFIHSTYLFLKARSVHKFLQTKEDSIVRFLIR